MNNPQRPNETVPQAQGPIETVPQDQPAHPAVPQAVIQVHQGPQVVVPPVMPTFSLGPGCSTSVLDFADTAAVKLYNKTITPLDLKFDGEADNLAVFLAT